MWGSTGSTPSSFFGGSTATSGVAPSATSHNPYAWLQGVDVTAIGTSTLYEQLPPAVQAKVKEIQGKIQRERELRTSLQQKCAEMRSTMLTVQRSLRDLSKGPTSVDALRWNSEKIEHTVRTSRAETDDLARSIQREGRESWGRVATRLQNMGVLRSTTSSPLLNDGKGLPSVGAGSGSLVESNGASNSAVSAHGTNRAHLAARSTEVASQFFRSVLEDLKPRMTHIERMIHSLSSELLCEDSSSCPPAAYAGGNEKKGSTYGKNGLNTPHAAPGDGVPGLAGGGSRSNFLHSSEAHPIRSQATTNVRIPAHHEPANDPASLILSTLEVQHELFIRAAAKVAKIHESCDEVRDRYRRLMGHTEDIFAVRASLQEKKGNERRSELATASHRRLSFTLPTTKPPMGTAGIPAPGYTANPPAQPAPSLLFGSTVTSTAPSGTTASYQFGFGSGGNHVASTTAPTTTTVTTTANASTTIAGPAFGFGTNAANASNTSNTTGTNATATNFLTVPTNAPSATSNPIASTPFQTPMPNGTGASVVTPWGGGSFVSPSPAVGGAWGSSTIRK